MVQAPLILAQLAERRAKPTPLLLQKKVKAISVKIAIKTFDCLLVAKRAVKKRVWSSPLHQHPAKD